MTTQGPTASGVKPGDLPGLVARLGERVLYVLQLHLQLIEGDLKTQARSAGGLLGRFALALALAAVGVGFLFTGVILLLARLGVPAWTLFLGGGVLCLILAAVFAVAAKGRLAESTKVFPRTLAEIEKDRRWIAGS